MKKILITGGSGTIGSELINTLQNSSRLFVLTRHNVSHTQNDVKKITCDLSTDFNITTFPNQIDTIIHLAQSEHFREFPEKALDVFYVNSLTTLKLLEYAQRIKAKTFIYASSGGIYGYGDASFTEDYPLIAKKDLGFYLGTKICSEIIAYNYAPYLNIIILRFFFVYGPRQKPSMLIPRLIKNVQEGNPIILQGNEGIRINPIYVSDAVRAVIQAMDLGESQIINVGGTEVMTLREIGEIIGEVIGKKPVFQIEDEVKPKNLVGDTKKMIRLLTRPVVSFKEGIQKMISQNS